MSAVNAMFDKTYLDRAMEMTKTGSQFFWVPEDQWHFAAQRHGKLERYTKTLFTAKPVFFETRLEIWPAEFKVTAANFSQPWPELIMLYHGDMCVWNRVIAKPRHPETGEIVQDGIIKLAFGDFLKEAIIAIQGIDPQLLATLQGNYQKAKNLSFH